MRTIASLLLAAILSPTVLLAASDWPQFRGPDGDGHTDAPRLPLRWSETESVRWKTPVHGRAWSSPVVLSNQVWITTATEDGRQLFAVALERDSGKIVHDLKLFEVDQPQFAHKFNTYASPTPVLEPGRVYVTFGSPGTACLDSSTGRVLWERRDFVCNHYRGAGSSPILWQNLLLLHFDGSDRQFVAALDKHTGQTVWQQPRSIDFKDLGPDGQPELEGDLRKSFATPHVATIDGEPVLLSLGAQALYAYVPATGAELWRVEERTHHSASTRPVFGLGLVFAPTGWANGQLLAVRPGRRGEVIDANAAAPVNPATQLQVVWKTRRNVPKKPSLLLVGSLLFALDDGGIATCFDATTGKEHWRERVGGNYSASPLWGLGRIYCFNEEGKGTVIEAGPQFRVLAENTLEDGFMASPAAAGSALFLRTKSAVCRIEEP